MSELDEIIELTVSEAKEAASEAAEGAIAELMRDGLSLDEAEDYVVLILDAALPLQVILPPPLGALAEDASDAAIAAAIAKVRAFGLYDPERIEERAGWADANGHPERAKRRRRRAQRIRARRARRSSEV